MKESYTGIGVMSGTSLDGLDIACIAFRYANRKWSFSIQDARTYPYPQRWKKGLTTFHHLLPSRFIELHNDYGKYIGTRINEFLKRSKLQPEFIASHGHTLMHQPDKNYTFQLGSGASIAAVTNIKTISDFRTLDVALGGQGAPLVPIGDEQLFSGYDYLLNLGGFANISFKKNTDRLAYDICPVNMALNYFAAKEEVPFDAAGKIGRSGKLLPDLFDHLQTLEFYTRPGPKSLGKEWFEKYFLPPIVQKYFYVPDILHTVYQHIASVIGRELVGKNKKCLVTGGGAHNTFLMELIQAHAEAEIVIPDKTLVDYKEALIFAYLGLLRLTNQVNCLATVTGARKDNIGGVIYEI
ncbi:MAG: anhydro-N-acetylmuramic acid kinase [Bacteroidota bacterium]